MATNARRKRWFETLLKHVSSEPIPFVDGCLAVPVRDWDWDGDYITESEVKRYLVVERSEGNGDESLHLASNIKELEALLTDLVSGHEFGEDSGWSIKAVVDLETDEELEFRTTVRVVRKNAE